MAQRILIGALSALRFHERRAACVATWANSDSLHGAELVFLVGDYRGPFPVRDGNLLHCPCPDDFASLPQKTRWFCRWALEHAGWEWLFKCDDDTYVCVDRLRAESWTGDYIGHRLDNYAPESFASGGAGYLLSHRAARIVAGHLANAEGPEDVLVYQVLRAAGIGLANEPRFVPFETDWPKPDNTLITGHHCTPAMMTAIHKALSNPDVSSSKEEQENG